MIESEVAGALIGVGALSGAWALRTGFDYMKYKITGRSNGHCKDHWKIHQTLKRLEEIHKDEKQVDLIVQAINRTNGLNASN